MRPLSKLSMALPRCDTSPQASDEGEEGSETACMRLPRRPSLPAVVQGLTGVDTVGVGCEEQ